MTELKDNCSLLSTINTILASKLSVENSKDSKVLPNSSLQTIFIHSKHVFPNLCNIRQFIHKEKKVERKQRVLSYGFFFFERKHKERLKMLD